MHFDETSGFLRLYAVEMSMSGVILDMEQDTEVELV